MNYKVSHKNMLWDKDMLFGTSDIRCVFKFLGKYLIFSFSLALWGWRDGRIDGQMDGWTDRRTDGRTDGRTDKQDR